MTAKIYLKYALVLIVAVMFSCKTESDHSSQSDRDKEIQEADGKSDNTPPVESIVAMNEAAEGILEYRLKQDNESYAAIEMDRWFCRFIAEGSTIRPVPDGQWLDFYPDLTYEYGNKDGTNGKGRFHYRFGDGVLLMVDDDKNVKPKEFDAKISGPVMVLVGKSTYNDNHIQMKFEMDNVPK